MGHIQRMLPDSSPGIQLDEGRVETHRSGEWIAEPAEPKATASLHQREEDTASMSMVRECICASAVQALLE